MYIDDKNTFSYEQDLSGGSGQIASTDWLKLAAANLDVGEGEPIKTKFVFTEALTAGVAVKVSFELGECATSDGTYTTVTKSEEYGASDIVKGFIYKLPVPPGDRQEFLKSFVNVFADSNGAAVSPTAGKVTSFLANE